MCLLKRPQHPLCLLTESVCDPEIEIRVRSRDRAYRFIARPSDEERRLKPYFCHVRSMSTMDVEMGRAVKPCAAKSRSVSTWQRAREERGREGDAAREGVEKVTEKGVAEGEEGDWQD